MSNSHQLLLYVKLVFVDLVSFRSYLRKGRMLLSRFFVLTFSRFPKISHSLKSYGVGQVKQDPFTYSVIALPNCRVRVCSIHFIPDLWSVIEMGCFANHCILICGALPKWAVFATHLICGKLLRWVVFVPWRVPKSQLSLYLKNISD